MTVSQANTNQHVELCAELGSLLELYSKDPQANGPKERINVLIQNARSAEAKAKLVAISSLMQRQWALNEQSLKQDVETESHYIELFQKKEQEHAEKLRSQKARLETLRGQLLALQAQKQNQTPKS